MKKELQFSFVIRTNDCDLIFLNNSKKSIINELESFDEISHVEVKTWKEKIKVMMIDGVKTFYCNEIEHNVFVDVITERIFYRTDLEKNQVFEIKNLNGVKEFAIYSKKFKRISEY